MDFLTYHEVHSFHRGCRHVAMLRRRVNICPSSCIHERMAEDKDMPTCMVEYCSCENAREVKSFLLQRREINMPKQATLAEGLFQTFR